MNHITSAPVNIQIAECFGEAPGNSKSCALATNPRPLHDLPRRGDRLLDGRLVLDDADRRVPRRPDGRRTARTSRPGSRPGPRSKRLAPPSTRATTAPRRVSRRGASASRGIGPLVQHHAPTTRRHRARRRCVGWPRALHRHPRARLGPACWPARSAGSSSSTSARSRSCSLNAFFTRGRVQRRHDLRRRRWTTSRGCCDDPYRAITLRTLGMAVAVTVTCAVLAFPIAYFMARVASPRVRTPWSSRSIVPLWASYLVKVYSWRLILSRGGHPQRGPRRRSGCGVPASVTSRSGSCSPTCGCRT